jgi:hypothetical protein
MSRHPGVASLAFVALAISSPALAAEGDGEGTSPHPYAAIETPEPTLIPKSVSGFATLTGTAQSIPSSRPRNQADEGVQGAAGIAAAGMPYEKWDYLAYLVVGLAADAVNGTGGSVSPEQITLRFTPLKGLSLQAGYMRIPFSVAQAAVITSSMFPTRPGPTAMFQSGADAGVLAAYEHPSGYVRVRLGLFDGLSLGLSLPGHVTHAPVSSAWLDVAPFGGMPTLEGDFGDSSFHVALGGGLLYRNGTAYDPSGYEGLHVSDTRLSAALRMAFKGLFVQGEYLHAIQTDDLSGRPRIARGTYGESSYYVAVRRKIGFAPLTRLGWSAQDEGFFPRHIVTFDTGLALYPRGDLAEPGALRVVLEYTSERHVEESESAYGALASVLYRF